MNHSSFPNFTIVLIKRNGESSAHMFNGNSILEWRYHIFGHIFGVYHGISPYIALKHRPKMVGTSNKSVLEMARRMHIAALWLMLTWRASWPSLRRFWRDPTGPKCCQNCWIPPLTNMQINGHLLREREIDG